MPQVSVITDLNIVNVKWRYFANFRCNGAECGAVFASAQDVLDWAARVGISVITWDIKGCCYVP